MRPSILVPRSQMLSGNFLHHQRRPIPTTSVMNIRRGGPHHDEQQLVWPRRSTQWHCLSSRSSSSSSSKNANAKRRFYRILQRQCLDLERRLPAHSFGEPMFLLQPPLDPRQSGNNRLLRIKTIQPDEMRTLLVLFRNYHYDEDDADDWLLALARDAENNDYDEDADFYVEPTRWTTTASIQKAIRHAFKTSDLGVEDDASFQRRMLKYAIKASKLLSEQQNIWRLSSVSYSQQIRVVASSRSIGSSITYPAPSPTSDNPNTTSHSKYRFVYRIRIENLSDQDTVQLLGRSWYIQELDSETGKTPVDKPIVVDAPTSGAVGQLPVLRPGDAFEYMSACELTSTQGTMEGSFHFAHVPPGTQSAMLGSQVEAFSASPDKKFEVPVSPFRLEAIK